MTIPVIGHTPADLESDADQSVGDALLAKIISRESVWVHRDLSSGLGLHPTNVLRYIAARDRADNRTGRLTWRAKAISARCGITAAKNDTALFATLEEAGLISGWQRPGPGTPYGVQFVTPPANRRRMLPLAALWTHRWTTSNPVGPRYGRDTPQVLRWLLAEMRSADFDTHGLTFTNDRPIPVKARDAGLSTSAYERAWAVVKRVCADDPWIQWEQTSRDDDGLHTWEITINWRLLPALAAAPDATTPTSQSGSPGAEGDPLSEVGGDPLSDGRGDPLSDGRVTHFVTDLYKEASPFPPVLSQPVLSPHSVERAETAAARAADRWQTGGSEESKIDASTTSTTAIASEALTAALAGQKHPDHASALADRHSATWAAWQGAVLRAIASPDNPRRLNLFARDVQRISDALRACYDSGWQAQVLATALTAASNRGVMTAGGVLETRLKALPADPTAAAKAGPAPMASAADRRAAEEDAVFARAARGRDASTFRVREM